MIDPGKLLNSDDAESFDDAPQNNDAFQLESLPTYPGELPFDPPATPLSETQPPAVEEKSPNTESGTNAPDQSQEIIASASESSSESSLMPEHTELSENSESTEVFNSTDSAEQADAQNAESELRATLEAELARSQEKRSRRDTLEDSINRLKAKLQPETEAGSTESAATNTDVEFTNAAVPAEASIAADSASELVDDFQAEKSNMGPDKAQAPLVDDFEELPVEVPADMQRASASLDDELVDTLPSTATSVSTDGGLSGLESDSLGMSESSIVDESIADTPIPETMPGKAITKRLVYGLVGAVVFVALAGSAIWWKMHSPQQGATGTQLAQNTQGNQGTQSTAPHADEHGTSTGSANEHPESHEAEVKAGVHNSEDKSGNEHAAAPTNEHPKVAEHGSENHETEHPVVQGSASAAAKTGSTQEAAHQNVAKPAASQVAESHSLAKSKEPAAKTDAHANNDKTKNGLEAAKTQQTASVGHDKAAGASTAHASNQGSGKATEKTIEKPKTAQSEQSPKSLAMSTPRSSEAATDKAKSTFVKTPSKVGSEQAMKDARAKSIAEAKPGSKNETVAPTDKVVKPREPIGSESKRVAAAQKASDQQKAVAGSKVAPPTLTAATPSQAAKENVNNGPEPRLVAKPVIKSAPATAKAQYTVQVYSSPSRDDAEEWMKRLKRKNIDASNLSMQQVRGTTYYRVRFGAFETKEAAENAALNSGFASSWVDRVK